MDFIKKTNGEYHTEFFYDIPEKCLQLILYCIHLEIFDVDFTYENTTVSLSKYEIRFYSECVQEYILDGYKEYHEESDGLSYKYPLELVENIERVLKFKGE